MAPWDSDSRLPIDTDEEEAQEDGAEGVGKGGSVAVRGAAGVGVWPLLAAVLWLRGVYSAFFLNVKWLSSCGTSFFAFGIYSPACVADLFGSWRSCWAICISRNDVIFNNSITSFPLHVIFRGTFWIRCRSILSKEEERAILKESSKQLEITAMEILNKFGWKFRNRIEG